jgi:signal-transduction protein with cAMP-binding, CBS, and nucleotidyltransferase domain
MRSNDNVIDNANNINDQTLLVLSKILQELVEQRRDDNHMQPSDLRMQAIAHGIALVSVAEGAEKATTMQRLEKAFVAAEIIEKAAKDGIKDQLQYIKSANKGDGSQYPPLKSRRF